MDPISGIFLIALGSIGAASFYVPFKKVKNWAWESYWIMQGVAAWLIAPWVAAWLTVPSGTLMDILRESPSSAKWLTIMFGALWGVGGLTFGLSIRYMGIALGQMTLTELMPGATLEQVRASTGAAFVEALGQE